MEHRNDVEAVRDMAVVLLKSKEKELKNLERFFSGQRPWPKGVFQFISSLRYYISTPDGIAEVRNGDYILQTLENEYYYLRFDGVE